ncbi:MAG: M23 family metallopeptidase, partial [bacterium]
MLKKLKVSFLLLWLSFIGEGLLFCIDAFPQTVATVDIINPINEALLRGTVSISADISISYGFNQDPTGNPRSPRGGFGPRGNNVHQGVDTLDPLNTPVRAVRDGIAHLRENVREVRNRRTGEIRRLGYGDYIVIDHGDGLYTLYAHLNARNVAEGQQVNTGDIIGHSGNSPGGYGYHLHFGVWQGYPHTQNSTPINPDNYLPTAPIRVRTTIDTTEEIHHRDYPAGTTAISYSTPWNTTQNEDGTHTVGVETQRLSTLANGDLDTREIGTDSVQVIVDNSTRVVEVPIQKSASPATPIAGGFQAASSLYFWDNQNNYWERWINSNLRVDSDNII